MAGKHISEDIIVDILSRLPIKSLIRCCCVSKRWGSIVSDPQLAKVQFKVASQQKPSSCRLLCNIYQTESIDLETRLCSGANFWGSKLTLPFQQPKYTDKRALGSCDGLVCLWIMVLATYRLLMSDDYKVVVAAATSDDNNLYSEEEFRELPLPNNFDQELDLYDKLVCDSWGGCLHVFRYPFFTTSYVELWVMREYGLSGSWAKLFNMKLTFPPEHMVVLFAFLAMETSTFVEKSTLNSVTDSGMEMMRIEHKGEPLVMGRLDRASEMTMYEERVYSRFLIIIQ
ncbi:hypothetical protein ACLB2K_001540 [Fragaria x ananassa]